MERDSLRTLHEYAMSFVGLPYRWGGDDPIGGYDCSGLVQEILASVGLEPPTDLTAQGLYHYFKNRTQSDRIGAGALAFYGKSIDAISHVALCIDHFRCIEAGGGGRATTTEDQAERDNAFVRIRPIKKRPDLIAVLMPNYPMSNL